MGLVKQAVSALTKRKIMQLTHTYITLPLRGEDRLKVLAFALQTRFGFTVRDKTLVLLRCSPWSLADISNKVGLEDSDDAEGHILNMVEAGEICAKITSPAGTVHFREDTHMYSSVTMTSRLESDLRDTAELTERVRRLEARLMTNPIFIQKARLCSHLAFCSNGGV